MNYDIKILYNVILGKNTKVEQYSQFSDERWHNNRYTDRTL